jgi:hypothetical protein
MQHLTALSALALWLAIGSSASDLSAQNLLANPGFEGSLAGWNTFGGPVYQENANPAAGIVPRSGSGLCKVFGQFTGGFNVTGCYQSFPATVGQTFTLDCWSRHTSSDAMVGNGAPNANWAVMKIAFFDAGGTELQGFERTVLDGTFPIDSWIDNAPVTGTAPPGAVTVQALLLFLQPAFDPGALQIDDIEFTTSGGSGGSAGIEIASLPPYGTAGSISGVVTGVNPATHRVTCYIYIDGSGWWRKGGAGGTVPIQANGTFTASIYSCCLDDRATKVFAAVIPLGVTPPTTGGNCVPTPAALQSIAFTAVDRPGRTIQFAGRTWAVKASPSPVGPGGNLFTDDPNDVFVDAQGRLHLKVVRRGGQWYSSEVVLLEELGYGTYWFTSESEVDTLDPNLTFGAFTWDPFCDDVTIPEWPNREIDFEDGRWGNAGDPTNAQVVVQPYWIGGNLIRYRTPLLAPSLSLTRFFTWRPDRIDFGCATGIESPGSFASSNILHQSTYTHDPAAGRRVPPAGREQFRFNLWINQGGAPGNQQTAEVIIRDFRFSDTVGAFPGGCGVNPVGSATIRSGQPALGDTVVLGFGNPVGTQSVGSFGGMLVGARPTTSPCGTLQPGWGMTGGDGELLLDAGTQPIGVLGGIWAGQGTTVDFPIGIPAQPTFLGLILHAQGVLLDPTGPQGVGLTNSFELHIQP